MVFANKTNIVAELQSDILRLEGFKPANNSALDLGLGPLKQAFPNASFPTGCVHEFISAKPEELSSTSGFIAGLLSVLAGNHGTVLWISTSGTVFPPALRNFGLQPDQFIFIDLRNERDVLWAMDEALKCGAVAAVVGEIKELSFTDSRRLQLGVEQSKVTGFVIRRKSEKLSTTACVSRWKITSLPSEIIDDLPGIGFPKWKVELLRMRNGKPGTWNIQWVDGRFHHAYPFVSQLKIQDKKAG
jgi:protein ImuA